MMIWRLFNFAALAVLATLSVAARAADPTREASGNIIGPDQKPMGAVQLFEVPKGVLVRISATGLTPGWHGVHIHETGACTDAEFKSAGAHIGHNTEIEHGLGSDKGPEPGDLPNLFADDKGEAHAEFFTERLTLQSQQTSAGRQLAIPSALVIHANPDDGKTQPIGGAGKRVACAVIAPAQ